MAILIEVTLFNEDTREVSQRLVHVYEGDYSYEIRATFEKLGEDVAKIVCPLATDE